MSEQERIDAIKALTEVYHSIHLDSEQAKFILDRILDLSKGL
jgi:hypothetical protein